MNKQNEKARGYDDGQPWLDIMYVVQPSTTSRPPTLWWMSLWLRLSIVGSRELENEVLEGASFVR